LFSLAKAKNKESIPLNTVDNQLLFIKLFLIALKIKRKQQNKPAIFVRFTPICCGTVFKCGSSLAKSSISKLELKQN
jgi:hypothetical protein